MSPKRSGAPSSSDRRTAGAPPSFRSYLLFVLGAISAVLVSHVGPNLATTITPSILLGRTTRMSSQQEQPDFVLFGSSGFIGSHIFAALQKSSYTVETCNLRLHEAESIEKFLHTTTPRIGVIVAAGTRGTPNIDWCLKNSAETIETNIVGQLNVVRVCRVIGCHVTLIGSG